MTWSGEINPQPTEFACVIRLANCYAATHVNGRKKAFISKHPEVDIKVAQVAAKAFAETHKIAYENQLQDLSQPIITVIKHEERWFPAELHSDKLTLLKNLGPLDLGGNQHEAINMANVIAMSRGADSIPSIGISLAK